MGKQDRFTVIVSAVLPEYIGYGEFARAAREGTEQALTDLAGPLEFAVIVVAA
jgi:hypothetical protein